MTAFDIIVVGVGPAGLATAAALAQAGFRLALIGPEPKPGSPPDTRTAALFTGSMALLNHLGATRHLAGEITPLTGIRIVDDGEGLLRAPEVLFEASEIGLPDFGANVAQVPLVEALSRAVADTPGITRFSGTVADIDCLGEIARVRLADNTLVEAPLVAAADGRNSFCRTAAGIDAETWDYPQVAITAQFRHSRPHRGISTEFHRPAGPCTVVPMLGMHSSLVWVERPTVAARIAKLDSDEFTRAVEERLHGVLGSITQIGPRRQFPLSCLRATVLGRNRVALIGESGHTMPPIGAQGLNLGFRDLAALVDLASEARERGEDIGGDDMMAKYAAARHLDIKFRATAVDLFNRSLLAEVLPADLARGFGIHAISGIKSLKRQVMRAGFEPVGELPSLMRA